MDKVKHIIMVIVFAMVGIMIVVNVIPSLYSVTITDKDRDNENAGWIRLTNTKSHAEIPVTFSMNGVTVGSGDKAQHSDYPADTIVYADTYLTVFIHDDIPQYIGRNTETVSGTLDGNFTISRNNIKTVIIQDDNRLEFPHSQYAMVPDPDGKYASFMNGSDSIPQTSNQRFVGGLMGFYCYDDMNTTDYDLVLHRLYNEDDELTGAEWRGQR